MQKLKGGVSMSRFFHYRQDRCFLCLSALSGCFLLFLSVVSVACHRTKGEPGATNHRRSERNVGFAVFGPTWPLGQVFANETEQLTYLKEQGYLVARHTAQLHGNMVRVPISVWDVLGQNLMLDPQWATQPVYQLDEAMVNKASARIQVSLEASLIAIEQGHDEAGRPLRWALWDAFFSGIQKHNAEARASQAFRGRSVDVDLVLVESPPALVIEAPSDNVWKNFATHDPRKDLWNAYLQLHLHFIRKLVQRYGKGYSRLDVSSLIPIVGAIELFNEPDYEWLPDEAKIEKALNPDMYPCDKYITQLHLAQVPENDLPGKGCVRRFGFYGDQALTVPEVKTSLSDFRWGLKFDKYVAMFADLHEHVSFAAKDEIRQGGARMVVVSSAVTHVNIDWFARMFRANPHTFQYIDKIAIHPYHWPRHDIHDTHFVASAPEKDWRLTNPREFARDYFKRFDFIRQLAALVTEPDQEKSYGLAGKALWITEFGLPTKKLGKANAALRDYPKLFIYDQATPIPEGIQAIIWEDLWNAFFDQVSPEFLRENHVETLLIYTLRETAMDHTHDDSHSNLALFRSDWSCRLQPEALSRLADLFLRFRE